MRHPLVAIAWPKPDYVTSLERAGATVRVLDPLLDDPGAALDACDGLLLTGGVDVDPARYGALRADVEAQLGRELPPTIAGARIDTLVGTAGTVTTLAALDLGLAEYDAARVQGHMLTRAAIERQRRRLAALDVAGRAALPCLEPGRADLIIAGVAIVQTTLDRWRCDALLVSDWSLREGLLAEVAAGEV